MYHNYIANKYLRGNVKKNFHKSPHILLKKFNIPVSVLRYYFHFDLFKVNYCLNLRAKNLS